MSKSLALKNNSFHLQKSLNMAVGGVPVVMARVWLILLQATAL